MDRHIKKTTFFRNELRADTLIRAEERTVKADWPLHWHDFLEIELITGGSSMQILNGQVFPLERGRLTLLRRTDYHGLQKVDGMTLLYLGLDDSLLSEDILAQIAAAEHISLQLNETEMQKMEGLLRLCILENAEEKPDKRYLKHLLYCIFLRIIRQLHTDEVLPHTVSAPMHKALIYIRMHFKENPKLEDVAALLHYNKSYFSAAFHKEVGVTYSAYVNQLKVDYAKELLLFTDLRITDICFECGFASQTNFLRLFKQNVGTTPLQFRLHR